VKGITSLVLFAVVSGCLAVSAWGQQVTAAFTGKVTDPTGAAVVGAKVTAIDVDRGTPWSTTTSAEGVFSLPRVPIGTYNVKVEKEGFSTATQSHITMEMNQVARLDFQLQVGSLSQTVEVTSQEPMLQTQATQLGQTIDERTNEDLPLATRNYVQLTLLAPGSIHPDPSTFKNGQTTMNSGRPNVNGNREQANNFMLDGLDNNQVSENDVGYAPSVDAIQEFNEITNNAPAEFGNFMGAIISTTTKSGSNQFHGSAFEFFRNNVLNANDWSNNFNGAPVAAIRWNNFGGTLGGPIKRDKLFFFVDYQGSRDDTPTSIQTTTVFTAAERQGNFSQLLSLATPIQLYNPFSVTSAGTRAPFAGNIIPASLFSPAAEKILTSSAYPEPINGNLINNYQYAQNTFINGDQGDVKIDYNISDKDRFYVRYSQSRYDNPAFNTLPLIYDSFSNAPTHTGVMDWTRTISPSLVNEARFGVNYVYNSNGAATSTLQNFAQTVGIPAVPSAFLPAMNFEGGNAATIGNSDIYQLFADAVIHYEDTIIWTKGSHTMHIGFQGYRYRIDTFYSGNNGEAGTFNFNGQYTTSSTTTKSGNGSGLAEADFLLGLPSEIQGGVNGGTWGQRSNSIAAFFQDDWRASPNLTFNLGLRWELHTPWDEVDNRQANFNLVTGQEYISGQTCPYNNCNALYNQYNGITNFQPRIGVAWTPGGGKLVVRSGYTLSNYLEGTGTNLRLPINPPFAHENDDQYTNSSIYGVAPGSTLDQGFLPFSQSSNQLIGATLRVWDPNVRPAVSNQWNFTLEYQLSSSTIVQASYVGQRATHLMVPMPYDQSVLNPNGTVSPTEYLAGNPTLLSEIGQISGTASVGNQDYEGLQLVAKKRLGAGLEYSVAYTYSKCMTNNMGYYGQGGQASQSNWYYQNIYDAAAEWGPCDYDAKSNFVANAVYDLPFGRGRTFGNNVNKAVDALFGGWTLAGILSLHTGFPLTISANDASNTTSRGPRADCIAPADVLGEQNADPSVGPGYQWFSPSSYAQPANGTFGSCGVGTVRGPGLTTFDFNVSKTFKFTERHAVDIRAEFINLANHPILNAPNTGVGPQLGLLNSSNSLSGREVQFALKYHF
jgi:Carboxypeptidase regulatory-like domain